MKRRMMLPVSGIKLMKKDFFFFFFFKTLITISTRVSSWSFKVIGENSQWIYRFLLFILSWKIFLLFVFHLKIEFTVERNLLYYCFTNHICSTLLYTFFKSDILYSGERICILNEYLIFYLHVTNRKINNLYFLLRLLFYISS